ncbi:DOPA-like domain protein [Metarhizium album ARSEF 1941]|uniref:DOPA-like domain protein n=1 Tax=Metarhizium album (strain ARSEF 1941) TaxID=1081103 RepID=A0A0B2WQF8_METAS|nr:DOPA-like domain protein [Metarhizium album ARSEF 1941]KHN95727.1 DOPA-like domain protein [Metarhizium album ARSEF 1941]
MTLLTVPAEAPKPQDDLKTVVGTRTREWHFHIYFLLQSATETAAALALRDAVLRLRRDGAFVAVPLRTVNKSPVGPHPAGSYEIWVPDSSFSQVFFYLATNRGNLRQVSLCLHHGKALDASGSRRSFNVHTREQNAPCLYADQSRSVLVHPLTSQQRRDHESRNGWLGKPWPIYLDGLPRDGDEPPLQYPELRLGWSAPPEEDMSLDERRRRGAKLEELLANDPEAAPAPVD